MVRQDFDRHLSQLQGDLLMMGSMVEKAISQSIDALQRRDLKASQDVIDGDDYIDQKRYEIEDRCINLIATQQPIAVDLRTLISILHISVELERMGDYAEGIAKISLLMGDEPPLKPLIDIPRMGDMASDMLHRSLDALVNRDVVAATAVCTDDDKVDGLYQQVYRELLTFMLEDHRMITKATFLLWVAHDLERIADRATNIAERIIYVVTAKITRIK